ncbi:DUF3846 domain-containing protein [Geodermatophilus sp. SYSU D00867]
MQVTCTHDPEDPVRTRHTNDETTGTGGPVLPGEIRVVLFPVNPAEPVTVMTVDDSDLGMHRALGNAWPDHVFLREVAAALLCDQDGKSKRLPPNRRATRFVDRYVPGFARADTIVGPAMVVGLDHDGSRTDVPDEVVRGGHDRGSARRALVVDGPCAPRIHLLLSDGPATA